MYMIVSVRTNSLEQCSDLREALFLCLPCKFLIHIRPLVIFAGIISRLGISCKVDQLVTPEMDVVELVKANEAAHGKIACVLCDESQFFTPEQADQLFLVTVDLGIPVICYGLRADFMMRGFPGSTRLLEIAHTIEELKTICACGRKAICNGRKVNGEFVFEGAQVAIDTVDDVEYQSLCPQCWYREYRAFLARHPKK